MEAGATLEDRITTKIDLLANYSVEGSDSSRIPWFVYRDTQVSYLGWRLLSLQVIRDRFTNANGTPFRRYSYHIGLAARYELSRDSFFIAGYESRLYSKGELTFRRDVDPNEDAGLDSAGYFILKKSEFSLNSNVEFLDSGPQFVFNACESASGPYAWSFACLFWEQLKPIFWPDGPLGWVLKEE